MMSFHKMAFQLHDAEVVIISDHAPLQKLIKNKMKNVLTQNWAFEIFSISSYITFQHIKCNDHIPADSLSHLQYLGLYEKSPPEIPGEEFGVMIFNEGEIIHEHAWPEISHPIRHSNSHFLP